MITIDNVSFTYGNCDSKSLDSISLQIHEGECILLCGKSGCGKTTLTRLINGIIPNFYEGVLEGTVRIGEFDPLHSPMFEVSKRVGSVFQNPKTQFYTVNTSSEIAFGCENMGMDPDEISLRVHKTAQDLSIEELLNKNIFSLSGGEKQKIAFASVYAIGPQVYVLDEPSANLDAESIAGIRRILKLLKQQGKTIIIAEHRIYYLKGIADRALYLNNGILEREYSMEQMERFSCEERMGTGIRAISLSPFPYASTYIKNNNMKLELNHVSFSYGKKTVLQIPYFQTSAGKISAIIGKNGAGKSTFASCLCGIAKKQKGVFTIDDKPLKSKERISLSYIVMQEVNHQLFSDSVREEITLGIDDVSEMRLQNTAETLDLALFLERHPMTLSGGQKQRVIIASAVFSNKRILIFDEPTSGLDYYHMIQTANLLKNLRNEKTFIFVISHDLEFVSMVCDDIVHIESGSIKDNYPLDEAGCSKLKDFFALEM